MRLPDRYRCDWPDCERTDITKVSILYDSEPRVHIDLCPPHAEPLAAFLELGSKPAVSKTDAALDAFLADD